MMKNNENSMQISLEDEKVLRNCLLRWPCRSIRAWGFHHPASSESWFQAQSSDNKALNFCSSTSSSYMLCVFPKPSWVRQSKSGFMRKRKHLCCEYTEFNTDKQCLVRHWIQMEWVFFLSYISFKKKSIHRKNQHQNKNPAKTCWMPFKQKAFCPNKKSYRDLVVFESGAAAFWSVCLECECSFSKHPLACCFILSALS